MDTADTWTETHRYAQRVLVSAWGNAKKGCIQSVELWVDKGDKLDVQQAAVWLQSEAWTSPGVSKMYDRCLRFSIHLALIHTSPSPQTGHATAR